MKPFVRTILLIGFLSLISCCSGLRDPLPDVYVNIVLDLNKPENFDLNAPGNFIYITGGIAGIIVYHDLDGNFYAYERACPYDYSQGGRVYVISIDSALAADTVGCGSRFSLSNQGIVVEGPARHPLRQYKTYYNPYSNTLQITSY
jgi:nitrite reductase/ring-hydroxylating ferredoxin subunit